MLLGQVNLKLSAMEEDDFGNTYLLSTQKVCLSNMEVGEVELKLVYLNVGTE